MAKQKPKVASITKPQYPQSELKKIGQPYDYNAIGFKNSQIDMLKSKMNNFAESYQKESADIIPAREAGFPMPQKSNRTAQRNLHIPGVDLMPDVSKRNYIIDKVYNAQGKLTGKKGVSKSALREHLPDLNRYRLNERADELKSSGDYIDSVASARSWAETKKQNARAQAKWDSTLKANGGVWDPAGGWPKSKAIVREIDPKLIAKMKPLPTSKTTRITPKAKKK